MGCKPVTTEAAQLAGLQILGKAVHCSSIQTYTCRFTTVFMMVCITSHTCTLTCWNSKERILFNCSSRLVQAFLPEASTTIHRHCMQANVKPHTCTCSLCTPQQSLHTQKIQCKQSVTTTELCHYCRDLHKHTYIYWAYHMQTSLTTEQWQGDLLILTYNTIATWPGNNHRVTNLSYIVVLWVFLVELHDPREQSGQLVIEGRSGQQVNHEPQSLCHSHA